VVVADHTKWLTVGLHTFAPLTAADVLVTDGEIDPEARATLAAEVNELLIAPIDTSDALLGA
jgi:DeoR/GlpR family transcriptional regulator of sugar metabolism